MTDPDDETHAYVRALFGTHDDEATSFITPNDDQE